MLLRAHHRNRILLSVLYLSLTGCGVSKSPQQAAKDLEASGKIPILDRSSDLKGTDADGNGIRDDIDTYIGKQSYSTSQAQAVRQYAKTLQSAVVLNSSDPAATNAVSQQMTKAIHCVFLQFGSSSPSATVRTYEKLTANTEARVRSYLLFDSLMEGRAITVPGGDSCEK